MCILDIVQACRYVLDFYTFGLVWVQFDDIVFEGELFGVSVDDSDVGLAVGGVFQICVDDRRDSER